MMDMHGTSNKGYWQPSLFPTSPLIKFVPPHAPLSAQSPSKLLAVTALAALGWCMAKGLTGRLMAVMDRNRRTKQQLLTDWKVKQGLFYTWGSVSRYISWDAYPPPQG